MKMRRMEWKEESGKLCKWELPLLLNDKLSISLDFKLKNFESIRSND